MKISAFLIAATLITPAMTPAYAQMTMDHKKMDMPMDKPSTKAGAAHKATGVVKNVDRNKGVATLTHDPVASLKWPAMTMGFTVKDKAMLEKLQPGKKVEFDFVQQGKDYVITSVK
jgi:Cu(I)/Ag(I) efflux system protein CusF